MKHYTCPRALVPVVEAALAAKGYVVEAPLQRAVGGERITVMTRGEAVISLREDLSRDLADISVYRDDEADGLAVLEDLPRLFPIRFDPTRSS